MSELRPRSKASVASTPRAALAAAILLGLAFSPAAAHAPYAVRQKTLEGPSGEELIVEKLFGDGIMFADPVSLQVRNGRGAIVAFTAVDMHVALFCRSREACWAFPHDTLFGFARPLRLEHDKLAYDRELEPEVRAKLSVTGRVTRGFERPNTRNKDQGFKAETSWLLRIAAPVAVLVDHWPVLLFLALGWLLPPGAVLAATKLEPRLSKWPRLALRALLIALIVVAYVLVAILLLMIMTGTAPWLYAAAVSGASFWAARRFLKPANSGTAAGAAGV